MDRCFFGGRVAENGSMHLFDFENLLGLLWRCGRANQLCFTIGRLLKAPDAVRDYAAMSKAQLEGYAVRELGMRKRKIDGTYRSKEEWVQELRAHDETKAQNQLAPLLRVGERSDAAAPSTAKNDASGDAPASLIAKEYDAMSKTQLEALATKERGIKKRNDDGKYRSKDEWVQALRAHDAGAAQNPSAKCPRASASNGAAAPSIGPANLEAQCPRASASNDAAAPSTGPANLEARDYEAMSKMQLEAYAVRERGMQKRKANGAYRSREEWVQELHLQDDRKSHNSLLQLLKSNQRRDDLAPIAPETDAFVGRCIPGRTLQQARRLRSMATPAAKAKTAERKATPAAKAKNAERMATRAEKDKAAKRMATLAEKAKTAKRMATTVEKAKTAERKATPAEK